MSDSKTVIHLMAAARPNFMKIAPLWHTLSACSWADPILVHTGHHYDANMSAAFFEDLGLPTPDHSLEIGSGTHAEQTGRTMIAYEALCLRERPGWVVVVGDVNATAACALAARKLCLPVAHLEAGLRSGDRSMPEEINRVVTDAIADLLWTPSPNAVARHFSLTHHGRKDSLRSPRERPPGRRRRGMSRLHLGKPVDPGFTRSAVACRDAATRHPPATQREHARHRPSDRRCPSELHEDRTSLPPPR